MEKTINNREELRAAVVLLNSNVTNMCNTQDIDVVCANFNDAKDLLVAIFKYTAQGAVK